MLLSEGTVPDKDLPAAQCECNCLFSCIISPPLLLVCFPFSPLVKLRSQWQSIGISEAPSVEKQAMWYCVLLGVIPRSWVYGNWGGGAGNLPVCLSRQLAVKSNNDRELRLHSHWITDELYVDLVEMCVCGWILVDWLEVVWDPIVS